MITHHSASQGNQAIGNGITENIGKQGAKTLCLIEEGVAKMSNCWVLDVLHFSPE
jgi:hypothetical protein